MKCYLNDNNSFLFKLCISYVINHSYSIKEVNDYLISITINGGVSGEKSEPIKLKSYLNKIEKFYLNCVYNYRVIINKDKFILN